MRVSEGFDLGFARAGIVTRWAVEVEEFCKRVLARHFPQTQVYGDINECFPESEFSAVVSPAKTLATQASAPELPEPVPDSGGQWCVPFAWYDRSTSSWRTWQRCLVEGWGRYSETWPRAGMTRSGIAYRRAPSVPPISEIESLLWPTPTDVTKGGGSSRSHDRIDETPSLEGMARKGMLYPTPAANEYGYNQGGSSDDGPIRPSLETMARKGLWPTPQAHDAKNGRGSKNLFTDGHYYPHDLADAVKMFPTPSSADAIRGGHHGRGESSPTLASAVKVPTPTSSRTGDYTQDGKTGKRRPSLQGTAKMLPTPKSRDWKGQSQRGIHRQTDALPNQDRGDGRPIGGKLSPWWVEGLMGFPFGWTDLSED